MEDLVRIFVLLGRSPLADGVSRSLVGHSEKNVKEDTGHLRVSYLWNHFNNVNSRLPSLRFGTGHIANKSV